MSSAISADDRTIVEHSIQPEAGEGTVPYQSKSALPACLVLLHVRLESLTYVSSNNNHRLKSVGMWRTDVIIRDSRAIGSESHLAESGRWA